MDGNGASDDSSMCVLTIVVPDDGHLLPLCRASERRHPQRVLAEGAASQCLVVHSKPSE
jgi:hypothetical protein